MACYYKWIADLVVVILEFEENKYSLLARDDLSNQVERRALQAKTTKECIDLLGGCDFLVYVRCEIRC